MTQGHHSSFHYKKNQHFDLYFSVIINELIFFVSKLNRLLPFLVPLNLSLHNILRCLLYACDNNLSRLKIDSTNKEFHSNKFYFSSITTLLCATTFLLLEFLDMYIRKFVSYIEHSHHIYFIDLQYIICATYL